MNELQIIIDYVLSQFQANKLVNAITEYESDLIDTNKDTLYPLVNIEDLTVSVDEDQIVARFRISALCQLEIYQYTTDSKLKSDTNYFDVVNETFSICQTFINSFRQYNSSKIEMQTVSELTPVKNKFINGLSGYEFDIELTIANMGTSCQ